ncbi:MAG: sel1 repeat family protein [Lachnospiraceae bacterium]|nr:sel1 repeat family protein [Lachnospiraceae bacterium]
MTVVEARKIVTDFSEGVKNTEEDEFIFLEAFKFLIDEEHDPGDMMQLGGYYYEQRKFDLALKYYEMAATFDYDPAYECLGYIWYYGRTGKKDFEKAYKYFSKLMEKGDLVATYKVADMYKNGYFVEKSQETYEEIIEDLYPKVKDLTNLFDPVPEVFTRLARIRTEQGETEEAVNLYLYAKDFLAQRIGYNAFFGNLNIMKWLIDDLYELIDFDEDYFDFFDMYYLLKTPNKVEFYYEDTKVSVYSEEDEAGCAVCANGKWYRSRDEFFANIAVGDRKLTSVWRELYGFKLL